MPARRDRWVPLAGRPRRWQYRVLVLLIGAALIVAWTVLLGRW